MLPGFCNPQQQRLHALKLCAHKTGMHRTASTSCTIKLLCGHTLLGWEVHACSGQQKRAIPTQASLFSCIYMIVSKAAEM
jgi:hypothetical protein